jgi:hypothetical protein
MHSKFATGEAGRRRAVGMRIERSRSRFARISDRDLAASDWAARNELERLRTPREGETCGDRSGEALAGAFIRIRELDALCAQLWQESQRRTLAGSIEAYA